MAEQVNPLLYSLAPQLGAYVDEQNPYNGRWKEDFYGAHYPRLLAIKRRYDPHGVFWCSVCVGSEGWAVREDDRLSRT